MSYILLKISDSLANFLGNIINFNVQSVLYLLVADKNLTDCLLFAFLIDDVRGLFKSVFRS